MCIFSFCQLFIYDFIATNFTHIAALSTASHVTNGGTVNFCALDITKAFDRMNHHGLFVKLMRRHVPVTLLAVLEYWLSICFTYVNWNFTFSDVFKLNAGVRQGGVLSPSLFALFIDDVIEYVHSQNVGCMNNLVNASIILYADDILLQLDLAINIKKSVCLRVGPRCHSIVALQ